MSGKGLEPSRCYPHEPESCASTNSATPTCASTLFNCQNVCVGSAEVDSRSTLSGNDTQSFPSGRVPPRHVHLFYLIVNKHASYCYNMQSRHIFKL